MSKYLKTKEGSIEDLAKQMQNKVMENDYQDKFKKALDKEGKPLGQMTGAEKKAFFNKIDKMHKGKDENAMSVADVDRLNRLLGVGKYAIPKNGINLKPNEAQEIQLYNPLMNVIVQTTQKKKNKVDLDEPHQIEITNPLAKVIVKRKFKV